MKGSASTPDLSEIETRESFPYMNCIIQLISSSSSGSWSRIAGSQQFNIKTWVCLLPQWYWHLLDWLTEHHSVLMCATLATGQCVVLPSYWAPNYGFQTIVTSIYLHVGTRSHVSYKKYLTYTSTVLLTTIRVLWSKAIFEYVRGIVGFFYTINKKYTCYPKYNMLYKNSPLCSLTTV